MTRATFDRELKKLEDEIVSLSSELLVGLDKAMHALADKNSREAQQLIHADQWVNQKRLDIVSSCLTLIATQQPAAGDMRLLATIIEVAGELERMYDYVKGIARISLMLTNVTPTREMTGLMTQMAEKAGAMLRQSVQAFTERDADLARLIPQSDDDVDLLYKQVFQRMIILAAEYPQQVEQLSYLEWAAHNLERLADRVTNICEWVLYLVVGTYQELSVSTALRKFAPISR